MFFFGAAPGFFAVKVTKESHIAEYFVVEPETILKNYEDAREASGGIVADFACDVQVVTTAGAPGSLDRQDTCSVIDFATERPAVWSIPVPASSMDGDVTGLTGCGYKQCTFTVMPAETEAPSATPAEMKTPSAASAVSTLFSMVIALGTLALELWNRLPM